LTELPVAVSVDATDFRLYSKGILNNCKLRRLNHAV
jgi:hypothetical protein